MSFSKNLYQPQRDVTNLITFDVRLYHNKMGLLVKFDKFKFIKLYPSGNLEHKMIVVIAACTKDPGDVADSVISYMNESEDEQPVHNLFD